MLLQPIPATGWFCAECGTTDPRKASALYHDVCIDCETPLPFAEPITICDRYGDTEDAEVLAAYADAAAEADARHAAAEADAEDAMRAAVYAARSAALGAGTLGGSLTPATFYTLRDRARQAAALALLDGHGLLEFASACAAYLEERYGFAVPGLCVLRVWCTIGLLTAEVVA